MEAADLSFPTAPSPEVSILKSAVEVFSMHVLNMIYYTFVCSQTLQNSFKGLKMYNYFNSVLSS